MNFEESKVRAAKAALSEVHDGFVVGLGTGSTVKHFARMLGDEVRRGLRVKVVPTSYHSVEMAVDNALDLLPLEAVEAIDVVVDGADEVDRDLNMIKGRGAALAREKVVASMARRRVYIVGEDKLVEKLCSTKPIPIEVLPFAYRYVMKKVEEMGGSPKLRRAGELKDGPIVTDNGNFIVDAFFKPLDNPRSLEAEIKALPGVVEVGLFCGVADVVYVGRSSGVVPLAKHK
ncbi:MAG: ribose-5-phosphate isomerase RpiA [Candidatus Nezhaarchaeota archaeon]|nr:ribose-5-phosphate isomerase RpiA [Candidatus Nezhaarchaeota archaeon]